MRSVSFALALLAVSVSTFDASSLSAQRTPRENDLKLPIGGTPGALVVGPGPVRTGVTIVHPRGKANHDPVFASWCALNGNGEMTGTTWVQESGFLEGPIGLTNTHSVGLVRDAIIKWEVSQQNVVIARVIAMADAADAPEQGSIIVLVATDAPLMPQQLKRVATRVSLGIGRQGGFGGNSTGAMFVAFSTANTNSWSSDAVSSVRMVNNDRLSPAFQATAQATEAAITNALLAAETTPVVNDPRMYAMPLDRMLAAMHKYGRMP